ncbi:AHH domain-containing protein [Salinarimonas rosea]|uniref:AHH domain-containing protein n=1 Tax=Salinarimonas rosea TaxID=552063 RepID=UPI00040FC968|nr:hypothetical protein [Salinarimonas rosea]
MSYAVLRFQVHHIFPREIFTPERLTQLEALGIAEDMNGNKVALVEDAAVATNFRDADQNARNALHDAGWGFARHGGFHAEYNKFIGDRIDLVLRSNYSDEAKRLAILDLHRFATEVSNGSASLSSGVDVYSSEAALLQAFNSRQIDYANPSAAQVSAIETYASRLDTTLSDVESGNNYEARNAL